MYEETDPDSGITTAAQAAPKPAYKAQIEASIRKFDEAYGGRSPQRSSAATSYDEPQGYAASLRQMAKWVREAVDPRTADSQRITLDDIDAEELDAAAAFMDRIRTLPQAVKEPVARAHITLEDDGPYARLEILNGERLQPSMSPVDLYVEQAPVGWSMPQNVEVAIRRMRTLAEAGEPEVAHSIRLEATKMARRWGLSEVSGLPLTWPRGKKVPSYD
jgi:hypothetical protein